MEEAKEDFSRQELKNKYEIIKHAIPKQWITKIETMEEGKDEKDVNVMLGEKMWVFKECTVKMFYGIFRDAVFKKPIINEFWKKTFEGLKEENTWNNMKGKIIEIKLGNLQYFIRHRVIFTDVLLKKIGMEQSATCKVCCEEYEGFLHLFLYCKALKDFNEKCRSIMGKLKGEQEDIEWNKIIMLGCDKNNKNEKIINLLVMLMKSTIWGRRVVVKQEKKVLDVWLVFKR